MHNMFSHVRKWFPWQERTRRKKEFLAKLKGEPAFQISKNTPTGATFVISNQRTGNLENYYCMGDNSWIGIWDDKSKTFTSRQLELHLTKLKQEATKEYPVHIMGANQYISLVKPS